MPISSLWNPFKVHSMWQVSKSWESWLNVLTFRKAESILHHPQSSFETTVWWHYWKDWILGGKKNATWQIKITTIMRSEWPGQIKHVYYSKWWYNFEFKSKESNISNENRGLLLSIDGWVTAWSMNLLCISNTSWHVLWTNEIQTV